MVSELKNNRKVVVIGIDGASIEVIASLVRKGRLPTFQRLLNLGNWGNITSTVPPISPLAWCSLATGLNPGQHGVFDFISMSYHNGRQKSRINTSHVIKHRTFWDFASRAGKKVIIYNYPFTFPQYPVNGILISGFPCPLDSISIYPAHQKKDLKRQGLEFTAEPMKVSRDYNLSEIRELIRESISITDQQTQLVNYLKKKNKWDLFVCANTTLDRTQHALWGYLHENNDQKSRILREELFKLYEAVDRFISKIISDLPDGTTTFIISDHGFEELDCYFGINNWLVQSGFLRIRRPIIKDGGAKSVLRKLMYKVPQLARLVKLLQIQPIESIFSRLSELATASIDFKNSLAWSDYPYGIRINEKQFRTTSELERFKRALITRLLSLQENKNGTKVIAEVDTREVLFHGDFLQLAPHLVLTPTSGFETRQWTKKNIIEYVDKNSGRIPKTGTHSSAHARKGIFIAYGTKTIEPGNTNPTVFEFAPLVLHALGLTPPHSIMDKRLLEIFRDGSSPH